VGLLPEDSSEHLVKRVIGLPGDHVVCTDPHGPVSVNGVAVVEPAHLEPGAAPCR
jgi:signal peptidase I